VSRWRALGDRTPHEALAPKKQRTTGLTVTPHPNPKTNVLCLKAQQAPLPLTQLRRQHPSMIITHATSATGHRRIYLGGKSSLECWLEPDANGQSWKFKHKVAPTAPQPTEQSLQIWANHLLLNLANDLNINPDQLTTTPFDCIAALHTVDPFEDGRTPAPRRKALEQGFMSNTPNLTRPTSDYTAHERAQHDRTTADK
jgi:hypothetical protein